MSEIANYIVLEGQSRIIFYSEYNTVLKKRPKRTFRNLLLPVSVK